MTGRSGQGRVMSRGEGRCEPDPLDISTPESKRDWNLKLLRWEILSGSRGAETHKQIKAIQSHG